MSGHSKWANTKYRKATQDVKKSKIFTKIIRELVTATKSGGYNQNYNSRLRTAVNKALSKNMNKNTLNRTIKRAINNSNYNNVNMEKIIYEGYGPGGSALMVECLSNNRNRTASKIRYAFNKYGGNLGITGSVAFLFKKKGIISFNKCDENTIIEAALKSSVDDVITRNDGTINVYTAWWEVKNIQNMLELATGIKASRAEISMISLIKTKVDLEAKLKLFQLINMLENYNDVQNIYHNGEISD